MIPILLYLGTDPATIAWMILSVSMFVGWCARREDAAMEHARRELAEFQQRFPGSCPICSFHRYRVCNGFEEYYSLAPDHDYCPERRAIA